MLQSLSSGRDMPAFADRFVAAESGDGPTVETRHWMDPQWVSASLAPEEAARRLLRPEQCLERF